MSKKQIIWCVFVAVFVLPFVAHFFVNIYWWLFDGNQLIEDKVIASMTIGLVGIYVAAIWADEGKVWK